MKKKNNNNNLLTLNLNNKNHRKYIEYLSYQKLYNKRKNFSKYYER